MADNTQDKQGQALVDELQEDTDLAATNEPEPVKATATEQDARYQELKDQYTRLAADFDNYRKRTAQEIEQARNLGAERAVMGLLPVIDNLERAVGSLTETSDPKLLFQSFRLMHNQLSEGLSNIGVKRIEALGQPFDPNFHEAISQVESADYPENTVAMEMQSGYTLNNRLLRPTLVSVSAGAPASSSAPDTSAPVEEPEGNPFRTAGQ